MEIAGSIVVLIGAFTFATAGLGLLRFPDVYTRASAVSTAGGFGMALVVVGVFLLLGPTASNGWKAVLVIVLQLVTAAVGSMAIGRAAYLVGVPLVRRNFDELATGGPVHDDDPEDGPERDEPTPGIDPL